jgi:hypothetical protein
MAMPKKKHKIPFGQQEPTPYERFQDLARRLFTVPKTEIVKREEIHKQQRPESNKKQN